MKLKKIIICLMILISISLIVSPIICNADQASVLDAVTAMKNVTNDADSSSSVAKKLGPIINAAIALIQIVGTGISVIMVTILGIKYMIAAPNDKADVKKQITPMLIGAVILFASVNIVQIIANFTAEVLPNS